MSTISSSSSSSSSSNKWVIFSSSKPMQPMPFATERRRWEEFDLYLLTNIVAATDSDSQQAQQEKTTFLYSFFIFLFFNVIGKIGNGNTTDGRTRKENQATTTIISSNSLSLAGLSFLRSSTRPLLYARQKGNAMPMKRGYQIPSGRTESNLKKKIAGYPGDRQLVNRDGPDPTGTTS